jgi:hypothetical protein
MATAKKTPAPAAKKVVPVAKKKVYAYITVDKNNYTQKVTDLVNVSKATIVTITVNQDIRNSFDVHYFTLS